jgi:secreted trypsin-like serine protease
MSGALDWVGTQSFVADSGQQGVCFGDSGGPFFLNTGPWMFGVLSKMTSTSNSCVPANAKQSGTRMTGTRMTQIQRWRQDQAYPMCDQVSSHYWACP